MTKETNKPESPYEFRREYLLRLPLPLAQLYNRAYNAKGSRERHDNAFYLWEATIKLAAATATASYLDEVSRDASLRNANLDKLLAQLALPSLGQWLSILRESLRVFSRRVDATSHPWISQAQALIASRNDAPALLALSNRIKNGPDGAAGTDTNCSILGVFEGLVQYRNGVFGHGAGRFESFYADEMGPLLFPALNELFSENVWYPLGPSSAKLVYITEIRMVGVEQHAIGLRELVGLQSERHAPLELAYDPAAPLLPNRVGITWHGRPGILRLDPLLQFRESDLSEELLFLNRDRNGRQIEYLSYTTGRTERDRTLLPEMANLLSRVSNRTVSEADLVQLCEQSRASTPSVEALWKRPEEKQEEIGEYELLSELGRGGMGVVYLARQRSLGRLVALKTLPSDLGDDEVALARFRREIRHLALCDSPYVVKLLASGTMPDGRIFYTMEYIQGSDLEQVWRELSQSPAQDSFSTLGRKMLTAAVVSANRKQRIKSEADTGQSAKSTVNETSATSSSDSEPLECDDLKAGRLESKSSAENVTPSAIPLFPNREHDPGGYIRRVVELIRDVATALQSIHDQDIVHRDIKPANMMLTSDGSRIVLMDFGLAKGTSQALTASRQGGLLGTLRYAAPEQLAAANIRIGPTADVRALGATLWELLTRKRLFGDALDEVALTHDVLSSDVPRLRSIDRRFDRDLDAIVGRATERRASDRIASAGRLAELLQLWLDGKPLPIRAPGIGEVLWRWGRENRAVVTAGAIATVFVIGTAFIAFVGIAYAMFRAQAALAVAQRQGDIAMESLQTLIFDIDQNLAPRAGMMEIRRKLLLKASEGLIKSSADLGDDPRVLEGQIEAQMQLGRLFANMESQDNQSGYLRAEKHLTKGLEIAHNLLSKYPNDRTAQNYVAVLESDLADLFLGTNRLQDAISALQRSQAIGERLTASSPTNRKWQRNLAFVYASLSEAYSRLGDFSHSLEFSEKNQAIAESLLKRDPNNAQLQEDLANSYARQGRMCLQHGKIMEAIDFFKMQLTFSEKAIETAPDILSAKSNLAYAHNWLSTALLQAGQNDEAFVEAQTCNRMLIELFESDPGNMKLELEVGKSYTDMAETLDRLGRRDESCISYEKALQILRSVLKKDPLNESAESSIASTLGYLAMLHQRSREPLKAKDYLAESILVLGQRLEKEPKNVETMLGLADKYTALGQVYTDLGDSTSSQEQYAKAIDLAERALAIDASNLTAQFRLALSLNDQGVHEWQSGAPLRAKPLFEKANGLFQQLVDIEPKSIHWQLNLASNHGSIARVSEDLGDLDHAENGYMRYAATLTRLVEQQPNDPSLRINLGGVYNQLGGLRVKQDKLSDAEANFRDALEIFERVEAVPPQSIEKAQGRANSMRWLGRVHLLEKDYDKALLQFSSSLEIARELAKEKPADIGIRSRLAEGLCWFGICKLKMDQPVEAREVFVEWRKIAEALAKDAPTNAQLQNDLISCYQQSAAASDALNDPEQAISERTILLNLKPEISDEWNLRGRNYSAMNAWDKAIADHTQAIKLNGENAQYHFDRALAYQGGNRSDEAKADVERAIELAPDNPSYKKALGDFQ